MPNKKEYTPEEIREYNERKQALRHKGNLQYRQGRLFR